MDRNIPHIRDIFSTSRKKSGEFQDLCVYDKSPRSRRKTKGFEPIQQENDQQQICQRKRNEKGKENHKSKNSDEAKLIQEVKNNTAHNKNHQYCSKTLTERDIRHLERHLSMKKTIRKQISRNLAQAFIDNPNLFEPDQPKPDYGVTQPHSRNKKLPKQEQNVLDILKTSIDDRDSGHSSPTTEVLSRDDDDYDNYHDAYDDGKAWNAGHRNSEAKLIHEDERSPAIPTNKSQNSEKRSIWKMFSAKNKTKR